MTSSATEIHATTLILQAINVCSYLTFLCKVVISVLLLQDGNAVIGNSGSRFREERDGEYVVLRENDTRSVLGVKESSTDPKTPIVTTSSKIAVDSQKWKYFTPEPPVRIISCL